MPSVQRTSRAVYRSMLCLAPLLGGAACDDKVAEPDPPPRPAKTATAPEPEPADLVIEDLKVGDGPAVEMGDKIIVEYDGRLKKTNFQFDTSKGKKPFDFTVGEGVIEGWSKGVVGMKVGGKRKLTIPPALGYGARGAGGVIPPNATLVFEVELLGVSG
jgi:FKBP-type peptidyl-prolyl cis-trans isomerase FkpA